MLSLLTLSLAFAQPAADLAPEADFRAQCSEQAPHVCNQLAYHLQAGSWGRPRARKALKLLDQTCDKGDAEACGMGLVLARHMRRPAREIRAWSDRACTATFAVACTSLAEGETEPAAIAALYTRACAAVGDYETCSVANGLRDPSARGPAPPDHVLQLIEQAHGRFVAPAGFEPVQTSPSPYFPSSYAIRSTDGHVEIHYLVVPWGGLMPPAFAGHDDITPEEEGFVLLAAAAMVAGGVEVDKILSPFPDIAVRLEFNADAGFLAVFKVLPEYSDRYPYAQAQLYHRTGQGDVVVLLMADDPTAMVTTATVAFHAFTFADPPSL